MTAEQPALALRERRVDYVEFASRDPAGSRRFFEQVFGWTFQDYGPDYIAFDDGRLQGGFFRAEQVSAGNGAPLVVLYADDLAALLPQVQAHDGQISKPVFSFPGGSRFHFIEPGGNELAVWSERDAI